MMLRSQFEFMNTPEDDPFLPNVDDIVEACPEFPCIEENKDEDEDKDVEIECIKLTKVENVCVLN